MAKLRVKEIQAFAKAVIAGAPGGIRYAALVTRILSAHPETPKNTVHGAVWDLDKTFPGEIVKPSRGLFQFADNGPAPTAAATPTPQAEPAPRESDFYESFAEWP